MAHDEIDRWLDDDEGIVPSSGFAASVMDAVAREASAPPAIPFPWKWALPGLASLGVALLAVVAGITLFGVWRSDGAVQAIVDRMTSTGGEIGWIAAAITLTVASCAWSWRLARG